jgi:hypothetical protein
MPQRVPTQEVSSLPTDLDASKLTADQMLAVREFVRKLGGIEKAKLAAEKLAQEKAA